MIEKEEKCNICEFSCVKCYETDDEVSMFCYEDWKRDDYYEEWKHEH